MTDASIAYIGRRLAMALMQYARERRDEDKKTIAAIQTELCMAVRQEAGQPQPGESDAHPS